MHLPCFARLTMFHMPCEKMLGVKLIVWSQLVCCRSAWFTLICSYNWSVPAPYHKYHRWLWTRGFGAPRSPRWCSGTSRSCRPTSPARQSHPGNHSSRRWLAWTGFVSARRSRWSLWRDRRKQQLKKKKNNNNTKIVSSENNLLYITIIYYNPGLALRGYHLTWLILMKAVQ